MSVGPGQGRTRLKDHVAQRLGILRGLGRFLDAHTGEDGALRCPRHRVEHTGWGAAGAWVHLASYRYTRETTHLEWARRAVLRAVDQVGVDPRLASGRGAEVFLPGAADAASGLDHAVESGACADALAMLLREEPEAFEASDRERGGEALTRVVDAGLAAAARDEARPTSRLWAALGVASAARLLDRDDWRAAARDGCVRLLDEMTGEGVVLVEPGGDPRAVSPVEQSRPLALMLAVHAHLGETPDARTRERLAAGLDVLVALRDGTGRKRLADDPRRRWWGGSYEVASHPFDAYALWAGGRLLERDAFTRDAGAAMEEWQAHLAAMDGGVEAHHGRGSPPPGSPECRLGWSAGGAWVARIIEDVPLFARTGEPVDVACPATGLLHVERTRYTAVLRGALPPFRPDDAPPAGGGTLQSLVVRDDPRVPAGVERIGPGAPPAGSFEVRPGGGGLAGLWGALRGDPRGWTHADADTALSWDGSLACFTGGVVGSDGRRLPGVVTERRYTFEDAAVVLEDRVAGEGPARCGYTLPAGFEPEAVDGVGGRVSRSGRQVRFAATGGAWSLTVRGRWPA